MKSFRRHTDNRYPTMKRTLYLLLLMTLTGCVTSPVPVPPPPMGDSTITNRPSGEWYAGIAIHFQAWPDDDTREAIADAGGHLKTSQGEASDWILPAYDRTNPFHGRALELSLKAGATLTGAKEKP